MATIKAFSDLEQSRKLAEILPLESADMKWFSWKEESDVPFVPTFGYDKETAEFYKDTKAIYLPCWSLAALLSVLPKIHGTKPILDLEENSIQYSGIDLYVVADNSVDACYKMIQKLNKLNLL